MKKNLSHFSILILTGILFFSSCEYKKEPNIDLAGKLIRLETLPEVFYPRDNQPSASKTQLGKMLYWDPIMSGEKDVSCASCHHPAYSMGDGLDLSIGVGGRGVGATRLETVHSRIPS